MTETAPKTLGHEDILSLIREAEGRFKPRAPLSTQPEGEDTGSFRQRSPYARVEDSAFGAAPEPTEKSILSAIHDGLVAQSADQTDQPPAEPSDFTPAPPAPEIDLEELRASAFEEGRRQAMAEMQDEVAQALDKGREEGRSEAAAVVAEARDIFLAATNALNDVAESDLFAGFATQLTDAIHSLASQRAGQEIDKSPKLFSRRIEKLAEKVARASEDLTIAFHPDDLSAIGPYLEAGSHLSEARLKVDMNLQRGDVKIDAGSIGLRDILGDRK